RAAGPAVGGAGPAARGSAGAAYGTARASLRLGRRVALAAPARGRRGRNGRRGRPPALALVGADRDDAGPAAVAPAGARGRAPLGAALRSAARHAVRRRPTEPGRPAVARAAGDDPE